MDKRMCRASGYKKTGLRMGDIDDVTLGSPAVFLGESGSLIRP